MSLGYCKYHKARDYKDNIFEVDENNATMYCPTCGKLLKTSEAIKAHSDLLKKFISRARFNLLVATNYEKAYRYFAYALEVQKEHPGALIGRLLSLLMMSTLRDDKFEDTYELAIQAFSSLNKHKIAHEETILALDRINKNLNSYLKITKRKLMHRIYFHDAACVRFYLNKIISVKKLRTLFLKEAESLKSKHENDPLYSEVYQGIVDSINKDEFELYSFYLATDGYSYKGLFDKKGNLVLVDDGIKQKINLSTYHPFTLNYKEKGKYHIGDKVFKSFSSQYTLFILTIMIIFFFGLFGVASLISSFVFYQYFYHFIVVSGLAFILSFTFIFIRIALYKQMRKRLK